MSAIIISLTCSKIKVPIIVNNGINNQLKALVLKHNALCLWFPAVY